MNIINLTPHELSIHDEAGNLVFWIPAGTQIARVTVNRQKTGEVHGIPLFVTEYGEVEGLPEPADDTIYVVSGMVRAATPNREDVYQPGELIRDTNGQPTGTIGLSR